MRTYNQINSRDFPSISPEQYIGGHRVYIEFTRQFFSFFNIYLSNCDLELRSKVIEMRGDDFARFWPATSTTILHIMKIRNDNASCFENIFD